MWNQKQQQQQQRDRTEADLQTHRRTSDWQWGEGEVIPGKAKNAQKGSWQGWVCARTLFQREFRMPV